MKHLFLPGILLSFLALPAYTSGPDDDLGTVPNSAAGGGTQPNGTRTEKPIVVGPCDNQSAGGTTVVTTCVEGNKVVLKQNGDALVQDGTECLIQTTFSGDAVTVGPNCTVGVSGPASPVRVGYGSEVTVHNSSLGSNMRVTLADGSSQTVLPQQIRVFPPISPPGGGS